MTESTKMELACILRSKRDREACFDYLLCMFCQNLNSVKDLSVICNQGVTKVKTSLDNRIKYQDFKNVDIIDRLQNVDFESADEAKKTALPQTVLFRLHKCDLRKTF